jgi:hypothetical protein
MMHPAVDFVVMGFSPVKFGRCRGRVGDRGGAPVWTHPHYCDRRVGKFLCARVARGGGPYIGGFLVVRSQ